jgi:hypothetical protein
MAESRGETIVIDGTQDVSAQVHRGVQAMWREQNAAFRARVLLAQLRQARPLDDQQASTA